MNEVVNPVLQVQELIVGSIVAVQIVDSTSRHGRFKSQDLKVTNIRKIQDDWYFLGEWTKPDGVIQLCKCCVNYHKEEVHAPYICIRARSITGSRGYTREAILKDFDFTLS